jgi:molybdate transport system ATP-binding protein
MSDIDVRVEAKRGSFRLDAMAAFSLRGITVILGPSGSGKTTLLRVIAGLEREAVGYIRIGAEAWLDSGRALFVPPYRRAAGFVFQDARLFPHLTVRGNLDYAARRARGRRIPNPDQIMRIFHLERLIGRSPATLSGGEIQRVAIARALFSAPKIMLMDEPLSALDLARRSEALSYIAQIPEAFAIPVLYVTHAIEETARLADSVAVMNNGRIIAAGDTGDVLSRLDLAPYLGRFEAGAVLEGRVVAEDHKFGISIVDIDGAQFHVPSLGLPKAGKVRLRIRARDVSIAAVKPQGLSIRNVIGARIEEIAEEEGTAFAELRLRAERQVLRARVTRASVSELNLVPGKDVYALVKSVAVDRQLLDSKRTGEGRSS